MQAYVWWFVLGFGLVVAELMTGTFYLLVIALALACAGVAAFFGAPLAVQLVVAAAIGLGGSMWLRESRFGKLHGRGVDPVQNMDIGQVVHIERWSPQSHGTRRLPRRHMGRRTRAGRGDAGRRVRDPRHPGQPPDRGGAPGPLEKETIHERSTPQRSGSRRPRHPRGCGHLRHQGGAASCRSSMPGWSSASASTTRCLGRG